MNFNIKNNNKNNQKLIALTHIHKIQNKIYTLNSICDFTDPIQ